MASDCLAAVLPANQKPCLKINFKPDIWLVDSTAASQSESRLENPRVSMTYRLHSSQSPSKIHATLCMDGVSPWCNHRIHCRHCLGIIQGDLLHPINLLHKSHNAPFPYPTMHHFVKEMCTHEHFCYKMVHCGIFVKSNMGFVRLVYTLCKINCQPNVLTSKFPFKLI